MPEDGDLSAKRGIQGPVARVGLDDPDLARERLATPGVEAVEIPRPAADEAAYGGFVRALIAVRPFKCDFNAQTPGAVLQMLSTQLLGGAFAGDVQRLAQDIAELQAFARVVSGGAPVTTSVRNYFAPGDLVWHLDRASQENAFRVLWPLGRPGGMKVTPADNIDRALHGAYMQREYPLLVDLDRTILRTPGATLESVWAHRPAQVAAMIAGRFPFVRDPSRIWSIDPNAASAHRIDTPFQKGTYHRSSWENHAAPGLQIVMTTGAP